MIYISFYDAQKMYDIYFKLLFPFVEIYEIQDVMETYKKYICNVISNRNLQLKLIHKINLK